MKYKKINIQGFRGIKHAEIEDLSMVNIFLGQNNSGKTSLLESIFVLTGLNSPVLVLTIDSIRNLVHNEENDFSFIFHNLDYNSRLILSGEMHERQTFRKLTILPKNTDSKKKITNTQASSISSTTTTTPSTTISTENSTISAPESNIPSLVNALEFKAEFETFQQQKGEYISSLAYNKTAVGVEFTTVPDSKKYLNDFNALYLGVNFKSDNTLFKRLEKLIIDKKKDEIIDSLKLIEKRILDITSFSNGMIYLDIGAKSMIPSNLMGDGFLKYLSVLINIHEVKDGIMLIDEIDNGLHFKALKNLWAILLSSAEKYKTQLFITTHSKEALIYLKEILEQEEYKKFQKCVRCYTLSKLKDNTVKAYKYDFDSFEYAINNDVEIRGEI